MFIPQWIIEKKRDNLPLSDEEIDDFISAYAAGDLPDYQMAAMAMAIYLNGMDFNETAALTRSMMHTGTVLDTSSLGRPVADKHSTGGIGDKVSLILAPIVAACGLAVPMISGRGLGITGGTLDKLESIPGYRTDLSEEEFLHVVGTVGCSIIGQTANLAPADKKLYALRDVTATVPSIPLITASIMCKKLAEGLDALVLDVKCGRGAFMKTMDDARALAQSMVDVGASMDKKVGALLTNMDLPLGHCIGNGVEVQECIDCLAGKTEGPLLDLSVELSASMLLLCKQADSMEQARLQCHEVLSDGSAAQRFRNMVEAQGGDPDAPLPKASIVRTVPATAAGYLQDIDAEAFGKAVLVLGGGRTKAEDSIDHAVGISGLAQVGDHVTAGDPLYRIHANDEDRLAEATVLLRAALKFSAVPVEAPPLVFETLLP